MVELSSGKCHVLTRSLGLGDEKNTPLALNFIGTNSYNGIAGSHYRIKI